MESVPLEQHFPWSHCVSLGTPLPWETVLSWELNMPPVGSFSSRKQGQEGDLEGAAADHQGRRGEALQALGVARTGCVGVLDAGGRVVHSWYPADELLRMSRGCWERQPEEASEEDREPGSMSNVGLERGRKGVTSCYRLVIPAIRSA